jgi:hypothetical protein
MKHRWHDEIVAWAGGSEIEFKDDENVWHESDSPDWAYWAEYRIKPQPKQPKYLYAIIFDGSLNKARLSTSKVLGENEFIYGKIEVKDD